jgi:adenylate cyclase
VGDTVNLGSRLEGLNKYYGTQILISETTYRSLENRCCARRADVVRVKGRREPVEIYQVSADSFPEGFPELYERAVDAYRRGERDLAGKLFRRCERMWPEDPLVAEYLRRIDRMEASPPEGWSYVKQHDSK